MKIRTSGIKHQILTQDPRSGHRIRSPGPFTQPAKKTFKKLWLIISVDIYKKYKNLQLIPNKFFSLFLSS